MWSPLLPQTGPEKTLKYAVKKKKIILVSTKSKQSSFGRRTWRGGNKVSRATHRCCLLWEELLQMVISEFQKNKASPSAHQTHNSRAQESKIRLEVTCTYQVGHAGKGGTSVWPYLGAHTLFFHHVRRSLGSFSAWWYLILIPSLMKIISTILKFYFLQVSNPTTIKVFSSSLLNSSQPTGYLLSFLTFNLPRMVPTDHNTLAAET